MQQGLTVDTLLQMLDEKPFRMMSMEYKKIEKMPADLDKQIEIKVISERCNHSCEGVEISALVDLLNRNKTVKCKCNNELLRNELNYEKYTGLRRKFHISQHIYSVFQNYVMTPFLFKFNQANNPSFRKTMQQVLHTLITNRNKDNYLSNLVQQKANSILEFDAICLMRNWKVVMPVRHKNCKHPECYELTSLLIAQDDLIQQNVPYKLENCYVPGCHSCFDMKSQDNLISDLVFDYELFNAINLGQSGIVTFILKDNQIKDSFSFYGKDKIISEIYRQEKQDQYQTEADFQDSVLKKCSVLLTHQNITDKILRSIQSTKYAKYEISMKDPFSKELIKYPGRCSKCDPMKHCADIRTLVSICLATTKRYEMNKDQKYGQIKEFACPLCKNKLFTENESKQPDQLFYFDFQLFEISNSEREHIIQSKQYELKHDGQKQLLYELLTKSRVKKETFMENQEIFKFDSFHSGIDLTKRLVHPLVLMSCPSQRRVDFSELFMALEKEQFMIQENGITLCKCETCIQNPIKAIKGNIFYDELMAEVLSKIKENQKNSPFSYNFRTKRLIFQDQLQQTKLIQEYLQDAFFELTTDPEYQNLFKTNENQITINYIQTTTPYATLQYRQEGIYSQVNDQRIQEINQQNENLGIKITGIQIVNKTGNQKIIQKQF